MAYRGTRGPSTSNNYESSYLERHNDSLVDELSSKVAALKKVSVYIAVNYLAYFFWNFERSSRVAFQHD
ncbi:hypothetical protein OESDEN_18055 [Oesophagostomum dentatum]|uniref:Uncharacterized protein n=1 Tax=Oesophagostomum dentatum TaxID=61180 RepID=A0A0B1SAC9_OESDE|nr:hypothetical protein OESDEN_18055 [Oesophagostomum dentatum]